MSQNQALTKQYNSIRSLLERQANEIAKAIPKHLTPERLVRIALTAIRRQPRLMQCDQLSIIGSIMEGAQLGLECDGVLGQAYLIAYKNKGKLEARLQIGYRGLIDLAYRSDRVLGIQAQCVREGDFFQYELGTQSYLRWVPGDKEEKRGGITHAFACAQMKGGVNTFVVLSRKEIDRIQRESRAESGPWLDWPEEMMKKTAIRRLSKMLPMSPELQRGMAIQDVKPDSHPVSIIDVPDDSWSEDTPAEIIDAETGEVNEGD